MVHVNVSKYVNRNKERVRSCVSNAAIDPFFNYVGTTYSTTKCIVGVQDNGKDTY